MEEIDMAMYLLIPTTVVKRILNKFAKGSSHWNDKQNVSSSFAEKISCTYKWPWSSYHVLGFCLKPLQTPVILGGAFQITNIIVQKNVKPVARSWMCRFAFSSCRLTALLRLQFWYRDRPCKGCFTWRFVKTCSFLVKHSAPWTGRASRFFSKACFDGSINCRSACWIVATNVTRQPSAGHLPDFQI